MKTNRDLYNAIEALLGEKAAQETPSLEVYLNHLVDLATDHADKAELGLEEFFGLLRAAFGGRGATPYNTSKNRTSAFEQWRATVADQVRDLREMAANGQLDDDQKYFGIKAPSGRYWYNFDPCGYIECGAAGALGGWEEGDATGREYVPGEVAYIASDGNVASADPRDLDRALVGIPRITWKLFSDFVWCGQHYE